MIALRQPSSYACRSTEPADWKKVGPSRKFGSRSESTSPFVIHASWPPAGFSASTGQRLCSYMYSQALVSNGDAGAAKLLAISFVTLPLH